MRITQGMHMITRHTLATLDIDEFNYATKYLTKMKAKFSYFD